ncbi:MAG TPA: hypothetical protein VK832_13145 [Burkholderiaceae bacterium]|jgi:hypothetical protein|nr:hypothetical protein [Burkholderiaceae bacterium]
MLASLCFLICFMLGFTTLAEAQIVECIDAGGKKTYAQSCPAGAEKQRDVDTPIPVVKPDASNDAAKKAQQDKENAFQQRRTERMRAEADKDAKQKKAADAAEQCEASKRRLDLLDSGRQYKRADPATGEHVPMDEDQRQAEIDRLHAEVQASCQ